MRKMLIAAIMAGLFVGSSFMTGCTTAEKAQGQRKYKRILAQDRQRAIQDAESYTGFARGSRLSTYHTYAE